jgi:glutamate dehydrogenase/leucine dehydrogenase
MAADGRVGGPEAVIDIACDIWIPAAQPDVVTAGNVERLKTRLVAEGANIHQHSLHARGRRGARGAWRAGHPGRRSHRLPHAAGAAPEPQV